MLIIYLSNYFNHHQKPLSDAFYEKTNGHYYFVETTGIPEERKKLGYRELDAPYVLKYLQDKALVDSLIMKADVVIIGEAPVSMVIKRLFRGQLTFHDNERRYKSIIKYLKWPIYTIKSLFLNKGYLLCASAFASRDFALSGMSPEKCYKWGYFTEVKDLELEPLLMRKSSMGEKDGKPTILWAARFIQLKHPELVVYLAERLRHCGYDFNIEMIGTGPMTDAIENMITQRGLQTHISLLGAMTPDRVRTYMEQADIFLATSDQNEGWGATINESMSSACAVVASHTIGAVPFLIEHKKNGMIFKSKSIDSLFDCVRELMDNRDVRVAIAEDAYKTMHNVWNPQRACANFISLVEALKINNDTPVPNGPCSKAPIYRNDWFVNI